MKVLTFLIKAPDDHTIEASREVVEGCSSLLFATYEANPTVRLRDRRYFTNDAGFDMGDPADFLRE
ncbi:hypothetical protein GETHLI_05530 [Geothrix limicola]|uniref:Uncharacterized protein n=1 Tax=Geothrix limicola TaxID=2927978 RepID=A0ABQ5QC86_9BACT|nr:hypothetical protein [Geothrix limicola]GLH72051.1 hypothetical protein GETHLI_05530 [Geothrix limicola]